MLSYHVVSQIGFMIAGLGSASSIAQAGGYYHIASNVLFKGLLFMIAGVLIDCCGTGEFSRLREAGRRSPLLVAAALFGSAAISGLPPFNGYASKTLLKLGGPGPITAALLVASERWGRRQRALSSLGWLDALVVGLAQALAIFPGISRSGATIAAGLGRGLRRETAARFSFLLATPIILGAGLLEIVDLVQVGDLAAQAPALVVGFVAASGVGFGCIHFLLRYLQRRRLYPFAVYCAAVGVACLLVALARGFLFLPA